MVRLNRIYTKTGDDGSTGLGDGTRVPKHHERIAAYGTVDELSSVLGLLTANGLDEPANGWVRAIQNELFDVGADLCIPGGKQPTLRVNAAYVERLEHRLDELNARLEPLTSFVLPGGTPQAAWFHLARTVCRRAERCVSALMADEAERGRVNPEVLRYLNRLSDLLFVMARVANFDGKLDVLWKPGATAG
jgi:cob(I)alamin adenosyltransferase